MKDRSDKVRYTFTVDTREKALSCYNYFIKRNSKINDAKKGREVKGDPDDELDISLIPASIMIYL